MFKQRLIGGLLSAAICLPLPVMADTNFDKGVRLYQQKSYLAAIRSFADAITAKPQAPTAYYYEGLCYQQVGDLEKARQIYTYIANVFPASPEADLVRPVLTRLTPKPSGADKSPPRTVSLQASPAVLTAQSLKNWQMSDEEWKRMPEETKVPFTRAASSHLFVDGYLNKHPMHMMFDTGAESCVFSKAEVDAAGIKIDPKTAVREKIGGAAGVVDASFILGEISLGDITRKVPICVLDQPLSFCIIGESFFKDFQYQIDNRGGFIRLVKKPRAGMASKVYESTDVIAIPYENHGDDMVVRAKVNGREIPMIFDTGSFAICFSAIHAMVLGLRVPPDAQLLRTAGAGGSVNAYRFRVDRIELGPLIKSQVEVVVNQAATPSLPLLGQPFFGDRRFTVDTDHHLIKFAH